MHVVVPGPELVTLLWTKHSGELCTTSAFITFSNNWKYSDSLAIFFYCLNGDFYSKQTIWISNIWIYKRYVLVLCLNMCNLNSTQDTFLFQFSFKFSLFWTCRLVCFVLALRKHLFAALLPGPMVYFVHLPIYWTKTFQLVCTWLLATL